MKNKSTHFMGKGGLWVIAQFILMAGVILAPLWSHASTKSLMIQATGLLLIITGGYFGIAGVMVLGRNRTPFPKPCPGSELIQSGIYARVRHPLYTSVILVSFGWGLMWHSLLAVALSIVLTALLAAKARREERWLQEAFPGYNDYSRRVPRFIPRF